MCRIALIFILLLMILKATTGYPQEIYTDTQIVNAIYWAEGGAKTNHPYGILTKYKVTTPRQACFNTVRNQRKRHAEHNCGKDFLTCLRDRYCPINADNDPQGLNVNWLKNVRWYLENPKEVV